MAPKIPLRGLYYITHINNIESILAQGIYSHNKVQNTGIQYTKIYDEEIISRRSSKTVFGNKVLPDFANLYFEPRNAMLYRVIREKNPNDLAIISIRKDILNRNDIFITSGNAASEASEIVPKIKAGQILGYIERYVVGKEYWTDFSDSKRVMMAECLIPDLIPPDFIESIYVASNESRAKILTITSKYNRIAIPDPKMFFQPHLKKQLTTLLWLVNGDMFFSGLQTMTVSVNIVGVMGKGLASRSKYQFPDVYVKYQDVCRSKMLKMGRPYIYKREKSFDYELGDDPGTMENGKPGTWFLLFPTKKHWRENADYASIEEGLRWVIANYKKEKIDSLAMPALGCGLGNLRWADIGPLMCKHLIQLDIPVWIYLPTEKSIDDKYLSKEHLLG